jgi:hypothetical protein
MRELRIEMEQDTARRPDAYEGERKQKGLEESKGGQTRATKEALGS